MDHHRAFLVGQLRLCQLVLLGRLGDKQEQLYAGFAHGHNLLNLRTTIGSVPWQPRRNIQTIQAVSLTFG